MRYPLIQDYIDSISFAQDNFAKYTNLRPVIGEGNTPSYKKEKTCVIFYMEDCSTHKQYCVKCFLIEDKSRKDFYDKIIQCGLFFPEYDSYYLSNELYVDSDVSEMEEFPVLIYPYSEKISLVDFIKANIDDKNNLNQIALRFSQVIKWTKDNNYYWKGLDASKILVSPDGHLAFSEIDDILYYETADSEAIQVNDASITMLLLSLKSIAINPSLFDSNDIKSQILFNDIDNECINSGDVIQQLLMLKDKEVNSLIGYLLICLNFNAHNGINSSIFCLKPAFESELEELIYCAENGDDKKQVELARWCFDEERFDEAFKWYEKAAKQGNPDGLNGMGCCYKLGYYVEKDEKRAAQLFIKAADEGSEKAMYNLAMAYRNGKGVELDWEKAYMLFRKLAERGDSRSQYLVGRYHMFNYGGAISWQIVSKRDTKEAFFWFEKSAKQGHDKAQQQMGLFYESGTDPCLRNIEKALEWYQKSADQGNVEAIFSLGRLYANGIDEKTPDDEKAYNYYLLAAEKNHPEAQYRVGVALYYGKGVSIDQDAALSWLEKSAEQKNEAATRLLWQLKSEKTNDEANETTEATEGEIANAKMDSCGVLYSKNGKKLLQYGLDDITEEREFGELHRQSLKRYKVPEGVEIICDEAFYNCESLEEIILPSSLKKIGNMAFGYCENLESIEIPEGIKKIEHSTFCGCSSLDNLVLPHSLETIDSGAFEDVRRIVSNSPNFVIKDDCLFSSDQKTLIHFFNNGRSVFEVPHGTEIIDGYAFVRSTIRRIIIPDTVSVIGSCAFSDCKYLRDISLPSSDVEINDAAFCGCESIYEIKLPKGLKRISVQLFDNCHNLTYVDVPDSVEEIGTRAFSCTNLKSVCLPKSLKKIWPMVFVLAPLDQIESNSKSIIVKEMTIYSSDCKELIQYYGKERRLVIPNTVVKIADYAFSCAYTIKELVIPNTVEEIGKYFLNEVSPEKIIVPAKLEDIVKNRIESYYHDCIFIE